jgi:branched-chain amino acid transport system ATP-binding protein
MLRAEHISVAYGAHRALEDVTLHVAPGEIVVILGANGAGKSTLLKAIARLIRPAPGATIAVNDNELTDLTPSRIVEQGLALVPEGRGVFADLTVGENLELGAYGRQARNQRDERLAQVLELFPRLAERRRQVVRTMSGGEQQMVAIGRALMSNPAILMLDEPSLGLSPILSSELFRTLSAVRDTGVGILLVEQNARLSLAIADRAYLLENGCIVGEGRAAVLANDPAVQDAYLGGAAAGKHKRFGQEEVIVTQPPDSSRSPQTPEMLADRAARIQREHIASLRNGVPHANGHAAVPPVAAADPIVVRSRTAELSSTTTDLARRATDILAAHIAARRTDAADAARLAVDMPAHGKKHKRKTKSKKAAKR